MTKLFRQIRQNLLNDGKTSRYLKYAVGEILLIVIGIFMALQLQNWNEANKIENSTRETIQRIKNEILTNQEHIDRVYDYHTMVKDTLTKIQMPTSELEVSKTLKFWRGLNIPRLQQAAFQTAVQTGVSREIDLSLLEKLNSLYTYQEAYNEFGRTASQGLYSKDFSDYKNFKKIAIFLNMIMVDLYYFETELKKESEACLHKIDSIFTR